MNTMASPLPTITTVSGTTCEGVGQTTTSNEECQHGHERSVQDGQHLPESWVAVAGLVDARHGVGE